MSNTIALCPRLLAGFIAVARTTCTKREDTASLGKLHSQTTACCLISRSCLQIWELVGVGSVRQLHQLCVVLGRFPGDADKLQLVLMMMQNSGCTLSRTLRRSLGLARYSCTYLRCSNKEILLATRTGQCERTLKNFVGQTLQQLSPLPPIQSSVCNLHPACAAPQCMRSHMHIHNFYLDAGIHGLLFIDVEGHTRNDTLQLGIVVLRSHSI